MEDASGSVPFNHDLKIKYTKEIGIVKAIGLSKEFKSIVVLTDLQGKEIKYIRRQIERVVLKGY